MVGACRDPLRDEVAVALQKDKPDVFALTDQNVAIGTLERRTGDDAMAAGASRGVDPFGDGLKPRPAVGIVERLAVVHLFDI